MHGLSPILHGNGTNPLCSEISDVLRAAVEYVHKEILLASRLSAPLIVHGGQIYSPTKAPQARKNALTYTIDSLRSVVAFAQKNSVDIWMENLAAYQTLHPFYNVYSASDEIEQVMSALPELGLILDIGHLNIGNKGYSYLIGKYSRNIRAISLSDNNGIHDTHSPLGNGQVDWKSILNEIHASNWSGIVVFETRGGVILKDIAYLKNLSLRSGFSECSVQ